MYFNNLGFSIIGMVLILFFSIKHIQEVEKENEALNKEIKTAITKGEAIGRYALYLHLKETRQVGDSIFVDIKRWGVICDSL